MKRYITFTATCLAAASVSMAQSVVDAVRFGNQEIVGTARYRAMGGAFGAVGGDPSCSANNPAGLAIYRGTSVFSFTPHLAFTGIKPDGSTGSAKTSDSDFALSNFAGIFSFRDTGSDYLVSFHLGLAVNRKAEATSRYDITINNTPGSFGSYLCNQANGYLNNQQRPGSAFDWNNTYTTAPILSMMAWNSYAIDADPANPNRVINPLADSKAYQRLYTREVTRHDNYDISTAFNIDDRFYLGATLSISDFSSIIETEFDEDYSNDYNGSYIALDNSIETKGTGVGFKAGMIFSPIDNWRIGASIISPIWSTMSEYTSGSMATDDDRLAQSEDQWSTYNESWRYSFASPWEYQFSTAFILGTRGILSFEYDMRDFTTMKYSSDNEYSGISDSYFNASNMAIEDYLQCQHTFKVGAEYRMTPQFSLRAGYACSTSPYTDEALMGKVDVHDQNITYYSTTKPNFQTLGTQYYLSAGAGWRAKRWYFDLAYVYHHANQHAAAYPGDYSECYPIDLCYARHNIDLTLGCRF